MLLDQLYRKHHVKSVNQIKTNAPVHIKEFELPYYSMIHYTPANVSETGIDINHPLLINTEEDIMVQHDFHLETPVGAVREVSVNEEKTIKAYHRRNLRAKRIRNLSTVLKLRNNPIIINHASASAKYQYRSNAMALHHEAYNRVYTTFKAIANYLEDSNWVHWIPTEVPERIPSVEQLKKAEEEVLRQNVTDFDENSEVILLEVWRYLRGIESVIDLIPSDALKRVNMVWTESGHWSWINLGDLAEWKAEAKGETLPRLFLQFMTRLLEQRTGSSPVTEEELADEEIVEITAGTSPEALTKPIMDKADELLAIGRMSTAEYRRMQKLSQKYIDIPSPTGEGTLVDHLKITKEDIDVTSKTIPDIGSVLDKNMLKSALLTYDSNYVDKVMSKDIANMTVAIQHAGIAVTDYKVEHSENIAGSVNTYTVKLQPVDGAPSTVKFTIPDIDKNGNYTVNGVRYRMQKQPCDLPIRKVKADRVALTSYYGKTFITRSERTVDDYGAFIAKKVIAESVGANARFQNLHYGNFNNPRIKTPRAYSGLSKRTAGFSYKDFTFNFDYSARERLYGKEILSKYEKDEIVVCGKRGKDYILMDSSDNLWQAGKELKLLGTVEHLLELPGKVPVDTAMINIYGKTFPLGMMLAYHLGLSKLIKLLNVKHRFIPKGTRVVLEDFEFGISFKDETLVLSRTDKLASIILSGFNTHAKQIKEHTLHSFDKPQVYNAVLTRPSIKPLRYLKELDLMFTMFIDHITLELLKEMNEPIALPKLLIRAAELLLTDDHPDETDPAYTRFRGYERMSGVVYTELINAVRAYRNKPSGTDAKVEMNPFAVAMAIQKDASVALVEESNPIHNLKEKEAATQSGTGGRSSRAMNQQSRTFHKNSIGTVSEATVDSAKVAVNFSLSADPKLLNVRGQTGRFDKKEDSLTRVMSTTASLSPFIDKDDMKRTSFASIQHSSTVGCVNGRAMPLTTGYEKVIAHRVDDLYAYAAVFDGTITALDDKAVELTDSKTKEKVVIEIGLRHGTVTGVQTPHMLICDLKKGHKFKTGDVITYNTGFFVRDFFDATQVQWKAGLLVNVALLESSDTLEDSSSISRRTANLLTTDTTNVRAIDVSFDQTINNLVSIGDSVEEDSILCTLEDSVLGDGSVFGDDALKALDQLAATTPKAKNVGTVDRIEVIYYGDLNDMSEGLRKVAKQSDRVLKEKAERLGEGPTTGRVSSTMRVGGLPLHPNKAIVKVYITKTYASAAGDKAVFGNQLKTVFGSVMEGRNETESGIPIDAKFSQNAIDARIVNSPTLMGTSNMLLSVMTKRIVDMYFE